MNFTIIDCEQRTPEWFKARSGRITGSEAATIFMGEKTAGFQDYVTELALGRVTGLVDMDSYVSFDMQRGIDKEPAAMMACELKYGVMIRKTGFIQHNTLPIGVSLDGDSDDFGMLWEFKCPKSKTHLGYLRDGCLPSAYKWQVTHELFATGAKELMFVSYDDRMPAGLELFSLLVKAQDMPLEEYERQVMKFNREVSKLEADIRQMMKGRE